MSLGFISTFTALNLPVVTVPLFLYTLISLYYRVKVNLHTREQLMVGSILGSFNGLLWSKLYHSYGLVTILRDSILNDQGLLPTSLLMIPLAVGAATVGSLERRYFRG